MTDAQGGIAARPAISRPPAEACTPMASESDASLAHVPEKWEPVFR